MGQSTGIPQVVLVEWLSTRSSPLLLYQMSSTSPVMINSNGTLVPHPVYFDTYISALLVKTSNFDASAK